MNPSPMEHERDHRGPPAEVEERSSTDPSPAIPAPSAAVPTRGIEEHLVSLLAPNSFEAEQYRALRAVLEQGRKAKSLAVIAISSPTAGDGKTLTAINLAGTLAQAPEARILLVEGDLRRPAVEEHLGLNTERSAGLVEAILDPGMTLERAVRRLPLFNLWVLPAGRCPASPYEVLKSPRLGDLLQDARRRFDYVLIDTPPILPVPDLRLITKWVDGFLIVVSAHRTPRRLLEEALYVADPGKVIGLVFNNDDRLLSRASGYYAYGRPLNGAPGHGGRHAREGRGES